MRGQHRPVGQRPGARPGPSRSVARRPTGVFTSRGCRGRRCRSRRARPRRAGLVPATGARVRPLRRGREGHAGSADAAAVRRSTASVERVYNVRLWTSPDRRPRRHVVPRARRTRPRSPLPTPSSRPGPRPGMARPPTGDLGRTPAAARSSGSPPTGTTQRRSKLPEPARARRRRERRDVVRRRSSPGTSTRPAPSRRVRAPPAHDGHRRRGRRPTGAPGSRPARCALARVEPGRGVSRRCPRRSRPSASRSTPRAACGSRAARGSCTPARGRGLRAVRRARRRACASAPGARPSACARCGAAGGVAVLRARAGLVVLDGIDQPGPPLGVEHHGRRGRRPMRRARHRRAACAATRARVARGERVGFTVSVVATDREGNVTSTRRTSCACGASRRGRSPRAGRRRRRGDRCGRRGRTRRTRRARPWRPAGALRSVQGCRCRARSAECAGSPQRAAR